MTNLSDIWTPSHCLSKSQLLNYIQQKLDRDEVYLVESHLNDCPLCSDALDGLMEEPIETTENQFADIKSDLEKRILERHPIRKTESNGIKTKEIKPPAMTARPQNRYRWMAAASILLVIGLGGYSIYSFIKSQDHQLAQDNTLIETSDATYKKTPDTNANEISSLRISPPDQAPPSVVQANKALPDARIKSIPVSPAPVAENEKQRSEDIAASPPVPDATYSKTPESKQKSADDESVAKNETFESADRMANYMEDKKFIQPQKEVLAKKSSNIGLSNSKLAAYNNLRSNQLNHPPQQNNTYSNNSANQNQQETMLEAANMKDASNNTDPYETAMQYYNAGQYRKSVTYFEKALKAAPQSQKEDIEFQLAEAYLKAGMNRKAEKLLEKLAAGTKYKSAADKKLQNLTK
jgi:tetratricopeptide (TPR) repeat protein